MPLMGARTRTSRGHRSSGTRCSSSSRRLRGPSSTSDRATSRPTSSDPRRRRERSRSKGAGANPAHAVAVTIVPVPPPLVIQEQHPPGDTLGARLEAALEAGFDGLELLDAGPDRLAELRALAGARTLFPTACPAPGGWIGDF